MGRPRARTSGLKLKNWHLAAVALGIAVVLSLGTARKERPEREALVECQERVRVLQGERELVWSAGDMATTLASMAHQHGRICRIAYDACTEDEDERQESQAAPPVDLRGRD